MGIIDNVYPDGVPVAKADVRADDKSGKRRNMAAVDDVRNADLSGQTAGIYVRELQQFYDLDTGDTTTADDGFNCLVDYAGNRFLRIELGSSSSVSWITPEQFGAVGDDAADDYAAFAAAVQEMIDTGAMLRLSAKRYLLKSKLEIEVDAEQNISIQGAGSQSSVMRFADPADGGIEYTSTTVVINRKPKLSLVGFTVSTTNQDCGTAIRASWADDVQLNAPLFMDDVVVAQDLVHTSDQGSDYGYWTDGIHVTNARNSTIRETFGLGELHLSPGSQSFIKLDGECTDFRLEGVRCVEWDKAIDAGGTSEGLVLTGGFSLVYCNYGFYADYAGGEPHIVLEGGHINAMLKNIYLSNALDYQIRGVNLTASSAFNTAPYPDWIGIHILGANARGGYIGAGTCISKEAGRSGGTQVGVKIDTGKRHIIDPIEIYSPDSNFIGTGILIDNSVTNSQVAYPIVENVTTPVNMGTGATNRLVANAALRADTSGNVRIANNVNLLGRNAADSGNLALIGSDTNDNVSIGSGLYALGKTLFSGTHLVPTGHQTYNFGGLTAQWNVGYFKNINSYDKVTVDLKSGGSVPSVAAGNGIQIVGADGSSATVGLEVFGSGTGIVYGRHAAGTNASKTATQINTTIMQFLGYGYGATGYSGGSRGKFAIRAAENFTDTAQGTYITLETAAVGATVLSEALRAQGTSVYFTNAATTASAANAYLDTGSTPANELKRSTSSIRYKRNVEPIEEKFSSAILSLRPVWYQSKCAGDNQEWGWWGLIAEEVAEIDPRLVHYGYRECDFDLIEVQEKSFVEEEVTEDGEITIRRTPLIETRVERRLKLGAEKVPDGVQYDRLNVLMLDQLRRLVSRVEFLEKKNRA